MFRREVGGVGGGDVRVGECREIAVLARRFSAESNSLSSFRYDLDGGEAGVESMNL